MSKITLAFGSFIVGACSAFLALSLIHTSTRVQASLPQVIESRSSEPVVPPLNSHLNGGAFSGPFQALDGIECAP